MHKTQKLILDEIKKNPNVTIAYLKDATDISTTSLVDYHLGKLVRDGVIRKGNKWEIISAKTQKSKVGASSSRNKVESKGKKNAK